jgi:hypothetical protein
VGSARNLGPDLTKWINHYKVSYSMLGTHPKNHVTNCVWFEQSNRVSAMVDLVNFILLVRFRQLDKVALFSASHFAQHIIFLLVCWIGKKVD